MELIERMCKQVVIMDIGIMAFSLNKGLCVCVYVLWKTKTW